MKNKEENTFFAWYEDNIRRLIETKTKCNQMNLC